MGSLLSDMKVDGADWAELGQIEFVSLDDITVVSRLGQQLALTTGGIILAIASDIETSLRTTPLLNMTGNRTTKARKAVRPLKRSADLCEDLAKLWQLLPRTVERVYHEDLILAREARSKGLQIPGAR